MMTLYAIAKNADNKYVMLALSTLRQEKKYLAMASTILILNTAHFAQGRMVLMAEINLPIYGEGKESLIDRKIRVLGEDLKYQISRANGATIAMQELQAECDGLKAKLKAALGENSNVTKQWLDRLDERDVQIAMMRDALEKSLYWCKDYIRYLKDDNPSGIWCSKEEQEKDIDFINQSLSTTRGAAEKAITFLNELKEVKDRNEKILLGWDMVQGLVKALEKILESGILSHGGRLETLAQQALTKYRSEARSLMMTLQDELLFADLIAAVIDILPRNINHDKYAEYPIKASKLLALKRIINKT